LPLKAKNVHIYAKHTIQNISNAKTRLSLSLVDGAQVYNNALMINTSCRMRDAVDYISEQLPLVREQHSSLPRTEICQLLHALYSGQHSSYLLLLMLL